MKAIFDRLNLNANERRLVVVAALAVFLVLNYWLVFGHFGDLAIEQTKLEEVKGTKATYLSKINLSEELTAAIDALENKDGGNALIPLYKREFSLQRIVNTESRKSGLLVSQTRPVKVGPGLDEEDTDQYFEEGLVLQVEADDDALIKFLVNVGSKEQSMIRVSDMTLRPNGDQRKLKGSITLVGSYERPAGVAVTENIESETKN